MSNGTVNSADNVGTVGGGLRLALYAFVTSNGLSGARASEMAQRGGLFATGAFEAIEVDLDFGTEDFDNQIAGAVGALVPVAIGVAIAASPPVSFPAVVLGGLAVGLGSYVAESASEWGYGEWESMPADWTPQQKFQDLARRAIDYSKDRAEEFGSWVSDTYNTAAANFGDFAKAGAVQRQPAPPCARAPR